MAATTTAPSPSPALLPLDERLPDTSDLAPPVLYALHELAKANLASADTLREAGSTTPSLNLGAHLESMARRRCGFASSLEVFLSENGGEGVSSSHSLLFTLGLIWDHLKLALQGGDPRAVIAHVLDAESNLEEAYRDCLSRTAASPLNALFMEHLRQIRADARTLRLLETSLP